MSTASQERLNVEKWAALQDGKLTASDPRFHHRVHIVHEDGSVFIVMDSFLEEHLDKWIVVFSEHHPFMVFSKEDLIVCQEYPMKLKDIRVGEAP